MMTVEEATDYLSHKTPATAEMRQEAWRTVAAWLIQNYQLDVRNGGHDGFCRGSFYEETTKLLGIPWGG